MSSDKPVILIGNAVFVVRPFLTPQGRGRYQSEGGFNESTYYRPGKVWMHQAQELLTWTTRFTLALMKGAVMDMMWLFATVMGTLLLGGIIVYKKSA